MKKEICCPECESTFTLAYKEEDVEGEPKICPFCSEPLEDDYLTFEDEEPIEIPDDEEE